MVTDHRKALLKSEGFKETSQMLVDAGIVDADAVDTYVQKIESISSKKIASKAVAVANDPKIVMKELGDFKNIIVGLF